MVYINCRISQIEKSRHCLDFLFFVYYMALIIAFIVHPAVVVVVRNSMNPADMATVNDIGAVLPISIVDVSVNSMDEALHTAMIVPALRLVEF